MRIGFIGLGVMGAPMARHLAAAGHEIATVLNRSPLPEDLEAERMLPFLAGASVGNPEQPRTIERKEMNRCAEPAKPMSS
jgi:predicted dinucleotide-binding enzyme